MEDVAITRISSKGQIVIPAEMRVGIKEGEKLMIIKDEGKFIIKKASEMDEQLKEDIEFARRTEAALKKIEAGESITMDFDNFIEEMKKW